MFLKIENPSITSFIDKNEVLDLDLEFSDETKMSNQLIKGSYSSGKTSKVLVPLFVEWEKGGIFFDSNCSNLNLLSTRVDKIYKNLDEKDIDKIVSDVLKSKKVYVCVNGSDEINFVFNKLMVLLAYRLNKKVGGKSEYAQRKVYIAIDDVHEKPKLNSINKYLMNPNLVMGMTLNYSNQLLGKYEEQEIKLIKTNCLQYDMEKQYI